MKTRLTRLKLISISVIITLLAACGKTKNTISVTGNPLNDLILAARLEGTLNVIALPHDWCNYGEMIDRFKTKYNIAINELNPEASSTDEIAALRASKGKKGSLAPDVIDVVIAAGPSLITEKLVQPYMVSTWVTIPVGQKDPKGYWYGDYYGVMAFEVNQVIVKNIPQDWADLLKPEYRGQVALSGDPRVSTQAQMSIIAAALANGGSLGNVLAGLEFFKRLNDAGNLVPLIANQATIAKGETPIILRWDYNSLADNAALKGNPNIATVIPKSASVADVYIQAISAFAPHPNAAKLWMEFLYSDEGQLIWMKGYCHPIRYNDLHQKKVIPADPAARLPTAEVYTKVVFPTIDQNNAALKVIKDNWMNMVGADIK